MRQKISYEVDSRNRLVARGTKNRTSLKRFRQVLEGSYKVDKKNRLYYEIKRPFGKDIPSRIKFTGKYYLDKNHDLILSASRAGRRKLKLNTRLAAAGGNKLVFDISSDRVEFEGSWKADGNNRLVFRLKRERLGDNDMTLFGAWSLSKNNEIIYTAHQKSKKLIFRGTWEITDRYKARYSLDRDDKSGFDFKIAFGKIVPRNKKTYVDFGVNVKVSKKKTTRRRVSFECRSGLGRNRRMIISVIPDSRRMRLRLDKKILKPEGIMFLESVLNRKEKYAGGGVTFRW